MYEIDDLVKIAKREKNKKRSYLFVNPLQGKHIPADPLKVDEMCANLSNIIDSEYKEKKKIVIGFAETATGVSAAVCKHMSNVAYYEHTTREYNPQRDYIFFTESHSHAKEQLLDSNGLEDSLKTAEVVIFIDDEITTGNTVCELIGQLKVNYNYGGVFIIASLVNSMTDERINELNNKSIECRFILRIPHEYKAELARRINGYTNNDVKFCLQDEVIPYKTILIKSNPRSMVLWNDYDMDMSKAVEVIVNGDDFKSNERVGIIGTEEFMYLTICLGKYLLVNNHVAEVMIHSTTRSPIVPSSQKGYPLNSRYKLSSLYSDERTTYIYNLTQYDHVVIVTDGYCKGEGLHSIISAVKNAGNERISVYRCKYEK